MSHATTIYRFLGQSGFLRTWMHTRRHDIPILTLHGVMNYSEDTAWKPLWQRMPVEQFDNALRILREHFEFISLSQAIRILTGAERPQSNCMVLTFDDGYLNNFTHALPILEELAIPATFFVCSDLLEDPRAFWIDRLDYSIQQLDRNSGYAFQLGTETANIDFSSRNMMSDSYRALRLKLKNQYNSEFETIIAGICSDLERETGHSIQDIIKNDHWAGIMDWQQAKSAAARGIEIGSHTKSHIRLGYAADSIAESQLKESKSEIEHQLGLQCRSLAYPNGSYSRRTTEITADAGYECAVTTENGINSVGCNPFTLKRISFPPHSQPEKIIAHASGLLTAVKGVRQLLRVA